MRPLDDLFEAVENDPERRLLEIPQSLLKANLSPTLRQPPKQQSNPKFETARHLWFLWKDEMMPIHFILATLGLSDEEKDMQWARRVLNGLAYPQAEAMRCPPPNYVCRGKPPEPVVREAPPAFVKQKPRVRTTEPYRPVRAAKARAEKKREEIEEMIQHIISLARGDDPVNGLTALLKNPYTQKILRKIS